MSVRTFKLILVCLLSSLCCNSLADTIKKEHTDLYREISDKYLVTTTGCQVDAYWDEVYAITNNSIIFSNRKEQCDVQNVYRLTNYDSYRVNFKFEKNFDNEYLEGSYTDERKIKHSIMIKSFECSVTKDDIVLLNKHKLTINGNKNCRVMAIYESDNVTSN